MRETTGSTVSGSHQTGVLHRYRRPLLAGAAVFLVGGALLATGTGVGAVTQARSVDPGTMQPRARCP